MSRLREAALVLGAYLVLTWLCLHPLFVHPASTAVDPVVPGGGGPIGLADVNLAIWKVAWACHALWSDPARLFDSNVYYPSQDALAGAEHRFGHLLLFAPVYAATGNPVLASQLHLFLSYGLCGLAVYLLLRSWELPRHAAFFGGFVYTLCPTRAVYGPVSSQLIPTQYLIFALPLLDRLLRAPRAKVAACFGLLLLQQMLCSYYLAYMSLASLAAYVAGSWIGDRRQVTRAGIGMAVLAVACAAVAMLPASLPYLDFRSAGGLKDWSGSEVLRAGSAGFWRDYLIPPLAIREWGWELPARRLAYVGMLPLALAVLGASTAGKFLPEARRKVGAALAVVAACWILALGPSVPVAGTEVPLPYAAAMKLVPGFSSLRAPMRFRNLMMIGVAALAAMGFARLQLTLDRHAHRRSLGLAALALAMLATAAEYDELRWHHGVAAKATGEQVPEVYRVLAGLEPGPVLELPIWRSPDVNRSSEYVYASMFHWSQPLLNGASQYPPPNHDLVLGLARALPDAQARELLQRIAGLRYVIVHRDQLPDGSAAAWEAASGFRLLGTFAGTLLLAVDAQRDADLLDAFRKQAPGEATLTGTALAPLARESREAAVSVLSAAPSQVHPDAQIFLRVRVTHATPAAALVPRSTMGASANAGPAWPALAVTAAHRTVLAYRWEDADGRVVASDFASNRVPFDLQPGQTVETTMEIHPPGGFGTFRLVVGVAQDEQWFPGTSAPVAVRVVPRLTKPERWVQESSGNRRLA